MGFATLIRLTFLKIRGEGEEIFNGHEIIKMYYIL